MAATRKTTSKKTTTRKKRPAAKRETKATQQAKKQMWAVVLFALGILLGALTWLQGDKTWKAIHDFLYGLFGWSVWFLAPLLIYIAVIAALDKPLSSIKAKLWQAGLLIVMISGAIQIFGDGLPEEGSFVKNIILLYENGVELNGGGVFSGVFALPLLSFADTAGAKIIIILAIFVFIMLVTGSTLISLFHTATKPVKGLESAYTARVESRPAKPAPAPKPLKKAAPRFDIDVKIDEPAQAATLDEFNFSNIPVEDAPFEPVEAPVPDLPVHPVTTSALSGQPESNDQLFAAFGQDSPVEYVAPEEFAPFSTEPLEAEPIPEPAPPVLPHPLEEDIMRLEETDETVEIAEIVDRYITGNQSPFAPSAPLPAPQEAVPAPEEPVTFTGFEPEAGETGPVPTPPAQAPEPQMQHIPPLDIPLPDPLNPTIIENPVAPQAIATPEQPPLPVEYRKPPVHLLKAAKSTAEADVSEELKGNAQRLVDTLKSFGVQTRITDICRGPAVTRYELQPSAGVKISKITGLADDIALNLAAAGIRIEAPIPNKPAVGIEVPNKVVSMVSIREIIDSKEFRQADSSVAVALGKDIAGNITLADIGKMPHVLIAGATGSGKSVCINSIIVSLLYKSSPDEVKLLMVDPKVVELGIYNGIPHLLVPVVTDPKKAAGALGWAVSEMLGRYKTFADNSVRDLSGYNRLAQTRDDLQPMPKIVIIIDELADLMMAAPNEVEDSICRLAQMARAAGMHLVIATQRPSVDVITGVIKANIPSRIAFAVSSQVDSRTILDMGGAEKLLGRGDMLFYPVGSSKPVRVQGCFVTDAEVEQVVSYVKEGDSPVYDQAIAEQIDNHVVAGKAGGKDTGGGFEEEDDMLPQAIECVVEAGQASTSQLQRRLKLGYARAARIIDQLEEKGIVGPFEGSKPRQVLISKERWLEMKLSGADPVQLTLQDAPQP